MSLCVYGGPYDVAYNSTMAAPPFLLGHRGARATKAIPENTLRSFDLALSHGCDGFEFDVRRTADGRPLICHDPTIGKLKVCDESANQFPGFAFLEDVLRYCAHRAFLDIELKVTDLETSVLAGIRECWPPRGFVVSSFLPEVVMELKLRSGTVPVGIICDTKAQLARWHELPVEYLIAEQRLISQKLVEDVHTAGRQLFAWTVNNADSMLRLARWGVDAIISDQTELMVKTLRTEKL
jgi:glycerophosphoryl diester phosphodiesterase